MMFNDKVNIAKEQRVRFILRMRISSVPAWHIAEKCTSVEGSGITASLIETVHCCSVSFPSPPLQFHYILCSF